MEAIEQLRKRADNGEKITYGEYKRLKRHEIFDTPIKTLKEWNEQEENFKIENKRRAI